MEVLVDFSGVSNTTEVHTYLKDLFGFPCYYGMNLDALYDCLTSISEYTEISILTDSVTDGELAHYGTRIIDVFEGAAKNNRNLKLTL